MSMSKTFEKHLSLFFFLVAAFIALASRWLPHPPNFTAVGGFLFVSGVLAARSKWYVLAAFLPLVLSDILLGGYPGIAWVYAGHVVVLLFGWFFEKSFRRQKLPFAVFSLSSAFLFFVLSNIGVWWSSGMYARTVGGLVECFVMALPFFHQPVLAQLIYGTLMVFGFYWLEARSDVAARSEVAVRE